MQYRILPMPAEEMRYKTLGDWFLSRGINTDSLIIQIDDSLPPHQQFLVGLHELVEAVLCLERGVTQKQVDDFDLHHEAVGREGEPGDHEDAPYRKEHRFAMLIEHLMAHELGIIGYGRVE